MYLMNAPPVVALQSRWEAFSQPRGFHFPDCFSEAKEDAARASVSARVQMVINTLQRDQAALGMSGERAGQRGQRAERCRDARLAANPAGRQEQPAAPARGLAAGCHPLGKDGAAAGGLASWELDSDSDDSVDRDIEEAIQEYLRTKGGGAPGPASRGTSGPPESLHGSALPTLCLPHRAPGCVPQGSTRSSQKQGSTSPASASSEDSLERSIRTEIEFFLDEKRQHENPKCDPQGSSARLKGNRELLAGAPPASALRGPCKEFVFRKPPRLAKVTSQPRSVRPKVPTEPENLASSRPVAPRPEAGQSRGGVRKTTVARRSRRSRSSTPVQQASDSSSDDGIEEAIQLYQLEKTRKEASGDPPARGQLREDRGPDPPVSTSSGSAPQSAVPEVHKRPLSKKKPAAPKVMDATVGGLHPNHPSKVPKDAKAPTPPSHIATRSEAVPQAPCRADTSAELMCAEAILDISKTILPTTVEGGDKPSSTSPPFSPLAVPPCATGDSSAIDSDDSIEQEIRSFLALKAQLPRTPLSKAPDPPGRCKRKRRGGGGANVPKKTRGARESTPHGERSQSTAQPGHDGRDPPSQGKATEPPGGPAEAKGQPVPARTVGLGDTHVSPSQGAHGKSAGEKESSEDKSSSLDSDEDLDTAIKDLLRSKRRLKRRCRDPRAACRRKVRFSNTDTRFGEKLGGLPGDWRDRGPLVPPSCPSKCRRDSPGRGPQSICGSSGGDGAAPPVLPRRRSPEGTLVAKDVEAGGRVPLASRPSSLSEDSSVDSDDSIELEIRRFLAEKAKESGRSSEAQGGPPGAPERGGPARPEMFCRREHPPGPQPGVCTRSQKARGTPQLAEGRKGPERAGGQAASLLSQAGKDCPRTEPTSRAPAALGRCEPALPRSASGSGSAKGSPAGRKSTCVLKDQSPRGAEPATTECAFAHLPGCAKLASEAGGAGGPFLLNYGSQNLPTPSLGAQADLTLPWSDFAHKSRLPSPWALNSGGGNAWTGVFGNEKEKGLPSQTGGLPSLASGFAPLLSTQLFHFGESACWGGKQAGLFGPRPDLPLQSPAFSAFRETQPGRSPVFGSPRLLVQKASGHWPGRKAQGRGPKQPDKRASGPEDSILDLRYRRRLDGDTQGQEALGSDAGGHSDPSVVGRGSSAERGKALKL